MADGEGGFAPWLAPRWCWRVLSSVGLAPVRFVAFGGRSMDIGAVRLVGPPPSNHYVRGFSVKRYLLIGVFLTCDLRTA